MSDRTYIHFNAVRPVMIDAAVNYVNGIIEGTIRAKTPEWIGNTEYFSEQKVYPEWFKESVELRVAESQGFYARICRETGNIVDRDGRVVGDINDKATWNAFKPYGVCA